MNDPEKILEEILETLTLLRSQDETKRKFPKDTWGSIIRLTKMLPLDRVCERLKINPSYLKQKIRESTDTFDFQEVPTHVQNSCFDTVLIELSTKSELKAKIQGPASCLNFLLPLFEG
ncbi:MAG: hypothetical protein WB791_05360 [Waddliaceae bacterium]